MLPNNQFTTDLPLGPVELTSVWNSVANDLKAALTEPTFDLWFSQCKLIKVEKNHAFISAPGSMYAIWIEENFREVVKSCLGRYLSELKGFSLDYSQGEEVKSASESVFPEFEKREVEPSVPSGKSKRAKAPKRPLTAEEILEKGRKDCGLNDSYTFETFVVGENTQLAVAASHAAIETPGTKYQPLFFHSNSGMGKTHLLHAIGWAFLKRRPHSRVLYVGAERFGNDYIDGIRNSKEFVFRKKYREVDLLLIDDVQFLSGKSGFQREFFHTFNSIIDQRNQIVIASDCLASEIAQLEERLVSRLQWGMTVELESPDEMTSQAILRKKRDDLNFHVSDETISKIVRRVSRNVRQLEGALIRTAMVESLSQGGISENQLDNLLADMVGDPAKTLGLEEIKNEVAEYFQVSPGELEGKRRTAKVTEARQVAMYLCRELTTRSLKEVARCFAKDHASVVYAVKTTKEKCEKSETLQNTVDLIRRRISRGNPHGKFEFRNSSLKKGVVSRGGTENVEKMPNSSESMENSNLKIRISEADPDPDINLEVENTGTFGNFR